MVSGQNQNWLLQSRLSHLKLNIINIELDSQLRLCYITLG